MKISISVDWYSLDISDILKNGIVVFYATGKIISVSFNTVTGTSSVGGGVLDDYIDKQIQKNISDRIKLALPETERLLSGFNSVSDSNAMREDK